jgi:6-phosphogluconolactonase
MSQAIWRWHPVADAQALQDAALTAILASATAAIAERGRFHLVLAGGTTPRAVYQRLGSADTDWRAWHVWFGDERCRPADDAERNSRMAALAWLDGVPIPAAQIHPIEAELGALQAAENYAQTLKTVGDFDLVLLGLGEDGHTASLFPGHPWGDTPGSPDTLAVFDAPKPPPQRVSLSAARLARTRQALFIVGGESKRAAVTDWRSGQDIPARAVMPSAGVDVLVEASLLA